MTDPKSIGIFGGTFDPIHFGHCRSALEIQEKLALSEIRFIPCKIPPHRPPPIEGPLHRLAMVSLALDQQTNSKPNPSKTFVVDDREIQREGPSYTVDTLMSLRREFPHSSLVLIVGVDAFLSLPSWYQWEKIIQLANVAVMYRSGWNLPESGIMNDLLKQHALTHENQIHRFTHGKILALPITLLDIHASKIRSMLQEGVSPRFLLPEKVLEYIQTHQLYGYNRQHSFTQSTEVI